MASYEHGLTDQGATISDSVRVPELFPTAIVDQGVTFSDSVALPGRFWVEDDGLDFSDSLTPNQGRLPSDTGTTPGDSIIHGVVGATHGPAWGYKLWGTFLWGRQVAFERRITDDEAVAFSDSVVRAAWYYRQGPATPVVGHSDSVTRHRHMAKPRPGPIPAQLARDICSKALKMLKDMPPYEADEPWVIDYVDAVARELQRIEDAGKALRLKMLPHAADDTYGTLGMWESILGLPVNPDDQDVAQRQYNVLARFRARKVSSGKRWVELVTAALHSTNWSHAEGPEDYTIWITIPYAQGSWTGGQVERLVRHITPAHLEINVTYSQGFILNVSELSEDRL